MPEYAAALNDRSALKSLDTTLYKTAVLREPERVGIFNFNASNLSAKVSADPLEGLYIAPSGGDGTSGAWVREVSGYFNVHWWGAKGDGSTDDSASIQAAIDTINSIGLKGGDGTVGGTLFFPQGTFRFQNVRLRQGVRILGAGRGVDGFGDFFGGTVFWHPSTAVMDGIADIAITAGGTGYTGTPAVVITGVGSGASAVATVAGGVVTAITLLDPGSGYTVPPTVTLSGGGGSGASAQVTLASRLFFTTGSEDITNISISDFTMLGNLIGNTQGIHLHKVHRPIICGINAYNLGLEAIRWDGGAGGTFSQLLIFGCGGPGARINAYRTGTLRIGGTDVDASDIEAGAPYGSQDQLPNCAVYVAKTATAGTYRGLICEGADTGLYIEGVANRFIGCRADINYGAGIWLIRTDVGTTPPWQNSFIGCWVHHNSKYGDNIFDNFRIESGCSINQTSIIGLRSTNSSRSEDSKARYGLYNGSFDASIIGYVSDGLEISGKYYNASGNSGTPGPLNGSPGFTFISASSSMSVIGIAELRITNSGGAITVSEFTGGQEGQEIVVHAGASNITLGHGGTGTNKLYLAGAQNRLLNQWSATYLRYMGGAWYEIQPWTKQAAIIAPSGGSTVDSEARTAINAIRGALSVLGLTA